ncbi:MAG: hypothetical protein ACFCUJ_00520 [Thiotrichales bacterium]
MYSSSVARAPESHGTNDSSRRTPVGGSADPQSVAQFNAEVGQSQGKGKAADAGATDPAKSGDAKAMLEQILQLLQQLLQALGGKAATESNASAPSSSASKSSPPRGGSVSDGDGTGVRSVLGNSNIPPPVDNLQSVQLGGKTLTVGGDGSGTASAAEVSQTAASIENLYANSPSFKQMIDSSPHQNLEVSVGRRADNTSWGGGGSVFMNLNNIAAGNSDTFQELLAHEFAHAAIDMQHGSEQDVLQDRIAAEA